MESVEAKMAARPQTVRAAAHAARAMVAAEATAVVAVTAGAAGAVRAANKKHGVFMAWQRKHTLIVIIATIVVVVGGGVLLYYKIDMSKQQAYIKEVKTASAAFNTGDYNTSIDTLRSLIANAPSKTEQGRLQMMLASALYSRNQSGDLAESMSLLKKVINDYSVAPWVRALTLNTLATIVISQDLAFYQTNLSEAPFNTYVPSTGTEQEKINTAYYNILKLSDETYPTSFAELSIAGNYLAPMIMNSTVASEDRGKTATLIQQYIQEADNRNDGSLYSDTNALSELLSRAIAVTASNEVLDNVTLFTQEQAYKRVFDALHHQTGQTSSDHARGPLAESVMLKTAFFYSSYLLSNYKNGERTDDITSLLAQFTENNAASNPYLGWLSDLKDVPNSNYYKKQALALAKVSPDFKAFLTETGVKF